MKTYVLMTTTGEYVRMYSRARTWIHGVDYFSETVTDINKATVFPMNYDHANRKDYQSVVDKVSKGNIKIGAEEKVIRTVTLISGD